MTVDYGTLGTVGGAFLVTVSAFIGVIAKRSSDRQTARDAAAKAIADRESEDRRAAAELEAKRATAVYDQMQDDLAATRTEVRSLQDDLTKARTDMTRQQEEMQRLWSQFTAVRRELDAAEAHIAALHRWDDEGRPGAIPVRKTIT